MPSFPMPASVWQLATHRSQAYCKDLQQIPSLNKQGELYNNKDPFSPTGYVEAGTGRFWLTDWDFLKSLLSASCCPESQLYTSYFAVFKIRKLIAHDVTLTQIWTCTAEIRFNSSSDISFVLVYSLQEEHFLCGPFCQRHMFCHIRLCLHAQGSLLYLTLSMLHPTVTRGVVGSK